MAFRNDGKQAEDAVKKIIERLNQTRLDVAGERIYDARSAKGRAHGQPGDFRLVVQGRPILIEVKSMAHDYRLPSRNFSDGQLARLHRRELAGYEVFIVVFHTRSKCWRCVPLAGLRDQWYGTSFDLQPFPNFDNLDQLFEQGLHIPITPMAARLDS